MIEILICVVIFVLINELAIIMTYGKFLDDEVVFDYINEYKPFTKNPFEHNILSPKISREDFLSSDNIKRLTSSKFIAKIPLGITSKYYISRVGRIPRWSKAHRTISELYKTSNTPNI